MFSVRVVQYISDVEVNECVNKHTRQDGSLSFKNTLLYEYNFYNLSD